MSKSSLNQKAPKYYTPEFRLQAIKLALGKDKSISQTAKDLGVPAGTLHTWVSKVNKGIWNLADNNVTALKVDLPVSNSSQKSSTSISQKLHEQLSAEQKKSAELERQVRRLIQEREILKKAMAYCLDVPK